MKRDGKIGKKILEEQKNQSHSGGAGATHHTNKPKKQCPPEKILNEKTNRCVKRDGKIGKKILAEQG